MIHMIVIDQREFRMTQRPWANHICDNLIKTKTEYQMICANEWQNVIIKVTLSIFTYEYINIQHTTRTHRHTVQTKDPLQNLWFLFSSFSLILFQIFSMMTWWWCCCCCFTIDYNYTHTERRMNREKNNILWSNILTEICWFVSLFVAMWTIVPQLIDIIRLKHEPFL